MNIERHFMATPDTAKEMIEQVYAELSDVKGLKDFCRINNQQNTAIVMMTTDPNASEVFEGWANTPSFAPDAYTKRHSTSPAKLEMALADPAIGTKKVRINLSAFMRVEYSEVIEVPANITNEELKTLAEMRYDDVDGGNYAQDSEYWVKGTVEAVAAQDDDQVSHRLADNSVEPVTHLLPGY